MHSTKKGSVSQSLENQEICLLGTGSDSEIWFIFPHSATSIKKVKISICLYVYIFRYM